MDIPELSCLRILSRYVSFDIGNILIFSLVSIISYEYLHIQNGSIVGGLFILYSHHNILRYAVGSTR